jgi:DNA-binding MarR family transcriptional regulator
MIGDLDRGRLAAELRASIGLLVRRIRRTSGEDDLTPSETLALKRLEQDGPTSPGELAKREQITPQSMGATLAALEARGLVGRRPDPDDGRRAVLSVTHAGLQALGEGRAARTQRLARALASDFTPEELAQLAAAAPLLERLAQSV